MLNLLTNVSTKVWGYVAAIVVTAAILFKVYSEGANSVQDKGLKKTLNALKEKNEIQADVDTLSDDDLIARLRSNGWTRD